MNDAEGQHVHAKDEVLFSSAYGGFPRFFWYFVIPFLLVASTFCFVRAVWFGEGILFRNIRVPPNWIAYAICPGIWGVCLLLVALAIYRRWNPQRVLVTTWGVEVPKGRFTTGTVSIQWEDLEADVEARNLSGWHVYEFIFTDLSNDAEVRVTSMLFPTLDEFATFMLIMGERLGQDWKIKGFWPGTIRGQKPPRSIRDER